MDYIKRELEKEFLDMSNAFKAVMVVGARQVGKSTMLKHLAKEEKRTVVSMDRSENRDLARSDPRLFFQMYQPPILIDEAQKAPELFEVIKEMCDESDETGRFWLTGSESKKLLKEAQDSMAGRVCILRMYSLSQREKLQKIDLDELNFGFSELKQRAIGFPENNILNVYQHIWDGGMPGMIGMSARQRSAYYDSYIDTYLLRDAVDDNGITDVVGFRKALRACAAFAGNIVNYSNIAEAAEVSEKTAKEWVKILESMGIIFLLEPYSNNELKRLTKTPKLYFCDTGLCAYLSMWTSRDALLNGAASGHYYENYVIGEVLRAYRYSYSNVNLTFCRDSNQKEINLIVEENGRLHPIEIKRASHPEKKAIRNFSALQKGNVEVSTGGIICMTEEVFPLDEKNTYIPCNII